jgi:hypothetical protein
MHRNTSPQSVSASVASAAYTPNMTSTSLSPNFKLSAGLDASAGHGMPTPQRAPSVQNMTQWGLGALQMSQYPAAIAQSGRTWDYTHGYLNAHSANVAAGVGVPAPSQALLQRSDAPPDLSQIAPDDGYPHYGHRTTRV